MKLTDFETYCLAGAFAKKKAATFRGTPVRALARKILRLIFWEQRGEGDGEAGEL